MREYPLYQTASSASNSLYSSSRLVTLCPFGFAFPLEQELLWSKVSQGLLRASNKRYFLAGDSRESAVCNHLDPAADRA
jgi:hypothetical protein